MLLCRGAGTTTSLATDGIGNAAAAVTMRWSGFMMKCLFKNKYCQYANDEGGIDVLGLRSNSAQ